MSPAERHEAPIEVDRLDGVRPAAAGREFRWLELPDEPSASRVFNAVSMAVQTATSGGVIGSDQRIRTPDGRLFMGISYRGDTDGWRHDLTEGAHLHDLDLALIADDRLVCEHRDRTVDLVECDLYETRSGP